MTKAKRFSVLLVSLFLSCGDADTDSNANSTPLPQDSQASPLDTTETTTTPDTTQVSNDVDPCAAFNVCSTLGQIECNSSNAMRECVTTGSDCLAWTEYTPCSDNNSCTLSECTPTSGCVHTPRSGACNADKPCTTAGTCQDGKCTGGLPRLFAKPLGDMVVNHLAVFQDNHYIVAGDLGGTPQAISMGPGGQEQWKYLFQETTGTLLSVVSVSETQHIFLGVGSNQAPGAILHTLDLKGELLASTPLALGPQTIAAQAVLTDDDQIITVGHSASDAVIVSNTTAGQALWSTTISPTETKTATLRDIVSATNEGHVAIGTKNNQLWAVKVSDAGDVIWSQTFQQQSSGQTIALGSDNHFILGGSHLILANAMGHAVWTQDLSLTLTTIQPRTDGSIAVLGHTADSPSPTLIVTDAGGTPLRTQTYSELTGKQHLTALSGGGFILAAQRAADQQSQVSRLDDWGHSSCEDAGLCADQAQWDCDPPPSCKKATCEPKYGCLSKPHTGLCQSGESCTLADYCEAGECVAGPPELYQKPYPVGKAEECRAVLGLASGDLIALTGHTQSAYSRLIRTNEAGTPLWTTTLASKPNLNPMAMAVHPDGRFILAGQQSSPGGNQTMPWITAVSPNGSEIQIAAPDDSGIVGLSAILPLVDGNLLFAGWTDVSGAGYVDGWLLATDAQGQVQWSKTYGTPAEERIVGLSLLANGDLALAGTSNVTGDSDFRLVRTDPQGNYLWQRSYPEPQSDLEEVATDVASANDGGVFILGQATSDVGDDNLMVVRVDDEGNQLWLQTFGGPGNETARELKVMTDNSLAIIGSTESKGAGGMDLWLIRLDEQGKPLFQRTYGGTEDDMGRSLFSLPGQGFLLGGDTQSVTDDQNPALWLIRTDEFGNADCATKGASPP